MLRCFVIFVLCVTCTCCFAEPRSFVQITEDQLAEKICIELAKNNPVFDVKSNYAGTILASYAEWKQILTITSTVVRDLKRVKFGNENVDFIDSIGKDPGAVMGFQTASNDLTFLGGIAGSDWEVAVFFLIYWDGDKLRAYIPVHGNPWNFKTRTAYTAQENFITFDGTKILDEIQKVFAEKY